MRKAVIMKTNSPRPISGNAPSVEVRSEMVRHVLDLRVHAMVMLLGGILVAYCGSRIANVMMDSVSTATVSLAPAIASIAILSVFLALLGFCLLEAHRCWHKAATISTQTGNERAIRETTRTLLNPLARPWHLPRRHA